MEMKERIRTRAADLFRRFGVKSITMDEIARQLGVSKKTIYQYFSDKDELVESVFENVILCSRNSCICSRENAKNPIDEFFQAIDFVQEMFQNMNPVMLFDLEKYHPAAFKSFLEFKNKFLFQLICTNLKTGIEQGYYRPEIDVDILARYRLEGLMAVFNERVFHNGRHDLVHLHMQVMEHFLFGIATLKGYKLILKYKKERMKT